MKSYTKKNKNNSAHNSTENQNSKKDFDHLNDQEKKNGNKPLNSGNHFEKKWFPNERK